MIKHINNGDCPKCAEKLKQADPTLVIWFLALQQRHNDCHISWSFRDEKSQNDCVARHLSQKCWPFSKHNAVDENGTPCSKALDLFQLVDGVAKFETAWYEMLNEEIITQQLPITWGGTFKTLRDLDHFQI